MSSVQEYKIDRTGWPKGPWDNEPDRIEWKTKAGLVGLMVRPRHGGWCGYVALPPTHPDHGKHYNELDAEIEAHGGLTYAEKCAGVVCHVPAPGEPDDVWWLGFDCVHSGDFAPGHARSENYMRTMFEGYPIGRAQGDYRDEGYVRAEVEKLAEQLERRALSESAVRGDGT